MQAKDQNKPYNKTKRVCDWPLIGQAANPYIDNYMERLPHNGLNGIAIA